MPWSERWKMWTRGKRRRARPSATRAPRAIGVDRRRPADGGAAGARWRARRARGAVGAARSRLGGRARRARGVGRGSARRRLGARPVDVVAPRRPAPLGLERARRRSSSRRSSSASASRASSFALVVEPRALEREELRVHARSDESSAPSSRRSRISKLNSPVGHVNMRITALSTCSRRSSSIASAVIRPRSTSTSARRRPTLARLDPGALEQRARRRRASRGQELAQVGGPSFVCARRSCPALKTIWPSPASRGSGAPPTSRTGG